MFKLISLAVGLLTVVSIAPNSEAMNANNQPISLQQPAEDLYSQIIFRNEDRWDYSRRERERRREEIERQREAERRQYRRERRRDREYYRREGEYYRRDGGYYRRDGQYYRRNW